MTTPARPERFTVEHRAVLALGSNLGDRAALITSAVEALAADPGIRVDELSPLYETPALKPEGISSNAPAYLNAVVLVRTILDPHRLLRVVNSIEERLGRVRLEHWGDRTIDIDIIDYDSRTLNDPDLTLPHPRAHERAFVLVPWRDVDPTAVVVGRGSVSDLAEETHDPITLWHSRGEAENSATQAGTS